MTAADKSGRSLLRSGMTEMSQALSSGRAAATLNERPVLVPRSGQLNVAFVSGSRPTFC